MATAVFSKVEEFDGNRENWTQYVERLGHFFDANGITQAEKKRAIFLSVIGPTTYRLLKSLVAPAKPGSKSFDDLVKQLSEHYDPTPSETVQRHKFHTRDRREGESVATFVSELRSIATFCNFGVSLDQMLRDRIMCGIMNKRIQDRLLSESKLDFKKTMEIALSLEEADKRAKELNPSSIPREGVHQVKVSGRNDSFVCHRCGLKGHKAPACRFKDTKCHNCGKVGHLKRVCRSRGNTTSTPRGNPSRQVHCVAGEEHCVAGEEPDQSDEYFLHNLGSSNEAPPVKVHVTVDSQPICMEIDTGVGPSLISESTFNELFPDRPLSPSSVRLRTYSGEPITVLGCIDANVQYKEQKAQLPILVVKCQGPTLLGRSWLQRLQLDWAEIHSIRNNSLQTLLDRHAPVFQEGLG